MLTGTAAQAAMHTTYNKKIAADPAPAPGFLQIASQKQSLSRQAARLLRRQAEKTDNPEIALIASSAQINSFTKVKASIDKMIATLTIQQSDEVKKNDYCKTSLQNNDISTMKAKELKKKLEASA